MITSLTALDTSDFAYVLVNDAARYHALVQDLDQAETIAFALHGPAQDRLADRATGIGFATLAGRYFFLPLCRRQLQDGMYPTLIMARLRRLFASATKRLVGHDLKQAMHLLTNDGLVLAPPFVDTMICSHLLCPGDGDADLASCRRLWLSDGEVLPMEMQRTVATAALTTLRLAHTLMPRLRDAGLEHMLHQVEMPLIKVLSDMERAGVFVETWALAELSPAQMAPVLQQPAVHVTNDGDDDGVLREMVHPGTGRVHPWFHQTSGRAGHLASSRPNLQGIPPYSDVGREFRRSVRAKDAGHCLIAAYASSPSARQGLAADLIKLAMIRCVDALNARMLATKLILQAHDELVFEAPEGELPVVLPLLHQALAFADFDLGLGASWLDAHFQ